MTDRDAFVVERERGGMTLPGLPENVEAIKFGKASAEEFELVGNSIIKGGRDEGGWCGLSMKFARENGYAVQGTGLGEWPLHSRNLKYDTPELRAAMAMHKAEEDWYDLGRREYDQKLSTRQLATCGFNNIPGAGG